MARRRGWATRCGKRGIRHDSFAPVARVCRSWLDELKENLSPSISAPLASRGWRRAWTDIVLRGVCLSPLLDQQIACPGGTDKAGNLKLFRAPFRRKTGLGGNPFYPAAPCASSAVVATKGPARLGRGSTCPAVDKFRSEAFAGALPLANP